LKIGESAIIGAGSVITTDVPERALAIARNTQENKLEKAMEIREKKSKIP
jgi:bifunctional UDP-N-acetylglucosamine pyrophosphorylase/glucosamine-1-phosphate N-acetyltransferase